MKDVKRYLYQDIIDLALSRNKMAFISGPRQVGKTTLSKSLKTDYKEITYKNWDESSFRKQWTKSPNEVIESVDISNIKNQRLFIFDEIHKSKNWKQKIKGIYDTYSNAIQILVTGSARLNIFKKGGDSLMGRYLNFRLSPLSLGELSGNKKASPDQWLQSLLQKPKNNKNSQIILENLLKYSGFPEPYFSQSEKILNIWQKSRVEKIIREDLRDLSRLPELSQIEMLASILPEKIGNPLSVQSLKEDLEVAHDTVKRWLIYLNQLYYYFEIKPWTKSITRTLKKESKIYLFDWTEVTDEAVRFENMIALHLLKACQYWSDTGEGQYDLYYLRNKEKQEIDFLIVKNKKPWLAVEAKLNKTNIDSKVFQKFQSQINCPLIQVILPPNHWRKYDDNQLLMSAEYLLIDLP